MISAENLEKLESTREDFPDIFLVVLSASADISTGWIYFYLGKPVEAIHLFKNAIKSDPEYSLSYLSLGYLYDSSGSFKSAIQYYKSVLKTDPDIWNNLGISYYNDGQIKNSISYFHKAIQLNLTFAYPVNNLGFFIYKKTIFRMQKIFFTFNWIKAVRAIFIGRDIYGFIYLRLSSFGMEYSKGE
ncbi:tetratricopeptide repeat protein [Leptospira interrogans serovar Hebdomadis]|uniref:tetratricopeptide repeat protein n=1 Tax=Leptospira interrogans TaxID=173 RepID=UPI0002E675C3|nr:tetratricopeptide repeat protein [Leptospira interrogans]